MTPEEIAKLISEDTIKLWHGAPYEALDSIIKNGVDSSIKPFEGYSNTRTYWAIDPNETQPAITSNTNDFIIVEIDIDTDEVGVPNIIDVDDPYQEVKLTKHLVGDHSIDNRLPMLTHEVFVPRPIRPSEIAAIYVVKNGIIEQKIGDGKLQIGQIITMVS